MEKFHNQDSFKDKAPSPKESLDFEKKFIKAKAFYERMQASDTKIRTIQNKLLEAWEKLDKYWADWSFWKETFNAIISFQEKNWLTKDWKVWTKTLNALWINKSSLDFYNSKDENKEENKYSKIEKNILWTKEKNNDIEAKRLAHFQKINNYFEKQYSKIDFKNIFEWRKKPSEIEARLIKELINNVNIIWNRLLTYTPDSEYRKDGKNHTMTPYEAIVNRKWDCEEYTAVKLQILKKAWIPEDYINFSYWYKLNPRTTEKVAHMLLYVDLPFENTTYILDNNNYRIYQKWSEYQKNTFEEKYLMNQKWIFQNWKKVSNSMPKTYQALLNDEKLFS